MARVCIHPRLSWDNTEEEEMTFMFLLEDGTIEKMHKPENEEGSGFNNFCLFY
jgi:hypothetical protein